MGFSRRTFLGTGAKAVIVGGMMASGKVFGANEVIRMGVVGAGGRGGSHLEAWTKEECSEVTAICDVDAKRLDQRQAQLEKATGKKAFTTQDPRDLLAREDVDAISIATPNHWHSLAAIWACQAGKDVYVEKPLSHNVYEGRQLVAAAEKYKQIVQHGTQSRSDRRYLGVMKALRDGAIGEVHSVRACVYKNGNRGSIGFKEDCPPPPELDWNIWQGPAEERPFNPNYHPYTWHWFWHYGNGEIGNQGVHQMDLGVWAMGERLPVRVYSAGGRYTYKDQGETPNTQIATFTYEDGTTFVCEVRNRFTNSEGGAMVGPEGSQQFRPGVKLGILVYGSDGYYVDEVGFFDTQDKPKDVALAEFESLGTWGNFLKAVQTRNNDHNFATALQGHLSCVHCHLANISYRLKRSLEFDPKTEQFVNDDEANALLTRNYRTGFEVPQIA